MVNRQTKQLFAILIGLNMLLLGVVGGHFMKGLGPDRRPHPPIPEEALMLSEEKQQLFQEAMKDTQTLNRTIGEQIDAQRQVIMQVMVADVFDEAAYQEAVSALHDLRGQQMQNLADAAKRLAKEFSIQERVILAQLLRRPPPPEQDKMGPPGGHPPPPHHGGPPPHHTGGTVQPAPF